MTVVSPPETDEGVKLKLLDAHLRPDEDLGQLMYRPSMPPFSILAAAVAIAYVASSAAATPPPPPAPHSWHRIAWQCPGKQRSFVEIEQLAQGSSGYQTNVVGLVIAGRKIDPAAVVGLQEMAARRNFLRPVGGYCENGGEMVAIEELASGPKSAEAGWRSFAFRYDPRAAPR